LQARLFDTAEGYMVISMPASQWIGRKSGLG
jgi:hypothetical protein